MTAPDPQAISDGPPVVRAFREGPDGYGWRDVPVLAYKPTGTHFHAVTRQVLFDDPHGLTCQLRYFELQPGGYSTLERHVHAHAVLVLRGRGRVLIGDAVHAVRPYDLVRVPPRSWHQFRADAAEPLGFLCLVPCDRDRPERPSPADLQALRALPAVDAFIQV